MRLHSTPMVPYSLRAVSTARGGGVILIDGHVVGDPVWEQPSQVYALAFDPAGRRMAMGSFDGSLLVVNADTLEPEYQLALGDGVQSVAFSPSGEVLAAGTTAGEVLLFDAATGDSIGDRLPEQRDWVNSLAFAPDGDKLGRCERG